MNRTECTSETVDRARATALTVAQVIGDLIHDTVVVGGLVPTLRYPDAFDALLGPHVGTHDFDLALDLAIFNEERYAEIDKRLRDAGFAPDKKETTGALVRQRWSYRESAATVEFIMPPVGDHEMGLQSLTKELGALRMIGIDLALDDRTFFTLAGRDLRGYTVERSIPVCGDAPFVVLKGLALGGRDKAKDAYDLCFVLRQAPEGPEGIAERLFPHSGHPAVERARRYLDRDFRAIDGRGPRFVCEFQGDPGNDDLAADALAYVRALLDSFR
ncbi:MAG TPA: hypothetical protein VFE35_03950 [Candidatus Cybelea sp.]|jgi:hypothetical protein|nr:hypothetical protein [Candidatus Cybelea sp.]